MISLTAPTANDVRKVRRILDGMVRANVKRLDRSIRIVVIGTPSDAATAVQQLGEFGFVGAGGSTLSFGGPEGRYSIYAYVKA